MSIETNVAAANAEETTGLPCLKSWRATYAFAMATFLLWIVLLFALTECFS